MPREVIQRHKESGFINTRQSSRKLHKKAGTQFPNQTEPELPLLILSSSCLIARKQIPKQLLRFANANKFPHKCICITATSVCS